MAENTVQSVARALNILECFTSETPSLTVVQIGQKAGLALPTVYRLLRALRERDLVVLDGLTRQYSLGPGIMRLARVVMDRDDVQSLALRHLQILRQVTEETVGLHWRLGQERVCIAEMEGPHMVRTASGVGRTYPLTRGAAGKAFLAFLPEALVNEVIKAAKLDPEVETRLRNDLEGTRKSGLATSFGETVAGASALAVPIFGAMGDPVAVFNITGPDNRWTREKMHEHAALAIEHAEQISQQLGYKRGGRFKTPGRTKVS